MPRDNGGVIGPTNNTSVGSGVWALDEIFDARQVIGGWPTGTIPVQYLVVAGGGGGGNGSNPTNFSGGGGGGGGLRSSNFTKLPLHTSISGEGSVSEPILNLLLNTSYTVTVGGGGAVNTSGSSSLLSSITSLGGGRGGFVSPVAGNRNGASGGCGGGAASGPTAGTGGVGTTGQGYAGGNGVTPQGLGGGGGGAGSPLRFSSPSNAFPAGGNGIQSPIGGIEKYYAGGGGAGTNGLGGNGGGGRGGYYSGTGIAAQNGTANTGGGGGGGAKDFGRPGANPLAASGGSGVVTIKYPSIYTISNPGGGLTYTTTTVQNFTTAIFTAGTGNIQFS